MGKKARREDVNLLTVFVSAEGGTIESPLVHQSQYKIVDPSGIITTVPFTDKTAESFFQSGFAIRGHHNDYGYDFLESGHLTDLTPENEPTIGNADFLQYIDLKDYLLKDLDKSDLLLRRYARRRDLSDPFRLACLVSNSSQFANGKNVSVLWSSSSGRDYLLLRRGALSFVRLKNSPEKSENFCPKWTLVLKDQCARAYENVAFTSEEFGYQQILLNEKETRRELEAHLLSLPQTPETIECGFELKVKSAAGSPISGLTVISARTAGYAPDSGIRLNGSFSKRTHRIYTTSHRGSVRGRLNLFPSVSGCGFTGVLQVGWKEKRFHSVTIGLPDYCSL